MIFNQQVTPTQFEAIKKQLLTILGEYLLNYVDEWPVDLIIAEVPKINRKFQQHYQAIPSKFWKWLKTLPNYSSQQMFHLTCLPEFLTK
jgi:hypothetical protein